MAASSGGGGGSPASSRLSFSQLDDEPAIASRLAAGLASLSVIEQLHKDVAAAQAEYASALRKASMKASQALSEVKDSLGSFFINLVEENNSFIVSMARLSEQMASASQLKIIEPIQQAKSNYARTTQAIGMSSTTTVTSDSFGNSQHQRKIRRADAKLKLAEDELATAEASRSELVTRFGDDLRPELYAKAKERVRRASALRAQAQSELTELHKAAAMVVPTPFPNPSSQRKLTINSESLRLIENAEVKRIVTTRDAVRSLVRLYFRATQSVAAPLIALGQGVESYSPRFDMQTWLAKTLNVSSGTISDRFDDHVSALSSTEQSWLLNDQAAKSSPMDQSMKNLLKQKEQQLKHLQEENSLLKEEIQLHKEQSFLLGGRAKKGPADDSDPTTEDEEFGVGSPAAIAASLVKEKSSLLADQFRHSSIADTSLDSQHMLRERNSSVSVSKSPEKASLLKRMATVLKGRLDQRLSEEESEDEEPEPKTSFTEEAEEEASEVNDEQFDEDDEEFRLADYVPLLSDRMCIEFSADTRTSDKLLEIERRFEEYLWAMRNLHIADLVRSEFWDTESYFRGFDIEYGVQCYTVKLPYNLPINVGTVSDTPHALEWGTPNVTASHWSLFAYETLLLIYHTMAQSLGAREVARLPAQDIHGIVLNDVQMNAPVDPKYRRHSQVDDQDDLDGVSKIASPQSGPPQDEAKFVQTESGALRLGEESTQSHAAVMIEHNAALIKNLIRLWRVRLQLSAQDNSILASLLLPQGLEFGEESHSLGFSPLDVRFRVSRLHASWVAAGSENVGDITHRKSPVTRAWIHRQLHFVRVSLLFKISRLLKFLPQARNIYAWLSDWPFRSEWHQAVASKIPPCSLEEDRFLTGDMSQLTECLKLALIMLADFFAALQSDRWGEDVYKETEGPVTLPKYTASYAPARRPVSMEMSSLDDDDSITRDKVGFGYRNAEGFLRFVALLSCIAGLDKCIRQALAEDERLIAAGSVRLGGSLEDDESNSESDEEGAKDDNPQDVGKVLFGDLWPNDASTFDIFSVLDANQVDVYWQYELPMQHLVVSELCQLVCDDRSTNKLSVDASTNIQAVLICSHMLQHGFDPSVWAKLKVPQVLMTLDTLAVYLIKAVWTQSIEAARKKKAADLFDVGNCDDSLASTPSSETSAPGSRGESTQDYAAPPQNFMVNGEVVKCLSAFATDLAAWLAAESGTTTKDTASGDPFAPSDNGVGNQRLIKLLESTPNDLFESLGRPRGEFRGAVTTKRSSAKSFEAESGLKESGFTSRMAGASKRYDHATDPDFALLDYDKLDELADKPSIFQQIENIRDEPEGVSLLLPSRVERVMTELCLRRLMTNQMRLQMYHTLCNYRQHCEAEILPNLITLYERLADLLVLTPVKIAPQAPDVNHFNVMTSLPSLLTGPIAQYDFYRHFICQTIRSLFDRLFHDAVTTIHNPTEEDSWFLSRIMDIDDEPETEKLEIEKSWAKVIGKFSEASTQFLTEIKAELIHYTSVWTQFLPGNQHALIIVHVAEERLRIMFDDLRNSPYWPEEDLPPNSAPIIAALSQFDRLVKEIRVATRFEHLLLDVEPLSAPLASSVATAMNKKLKAIDSLLDRCIKAENWRPISPPDILHSAATVDFFQFVHHVLDAVWKFNAAMEWILPILCQFISRLTRIFSDWVVQSTVDARLLTVAAKSNQIFRHLTSPIPRVDVSLLGQLIGGSKDRRKKGLMGLIGLKGKKNKHKDIASQLQQLQRQAKDYTADISPMYSADDSDQSRDGGEVTEVDDDTGSDPEKSGRKKKRSKHKKHESQEDPDLPGEADISDELKELAARIGPILAVQLMNVGTALGKSPLPSWLTRLHNLSFFGEQLPELAQKILNIAIEQSGSHDARDVEILKALEKAGGRKAALKHDKDPDDQIASRMNTWTQQLYGAVEQCKSQLQIRANEVCRMMALRVVYLDLCSDLFEELYCPTFSSGPCLDDVVQAMNRTVLKFVQAAPQQHQSELLKCIMHELIKAWAMVLTELGYMGHCFSSEDLQVIENDLESIRTYTMSHNVDPELELYGGPNEKEKGGLLAKIRGDDKDQPLQPGQTVNVFDQMAEFIAFLGSQPLLLAQLGGNYSPDKLKQKQNLASQVADGPAVEEPPEVPNVFVELGGGPSVAFDAKDILGAKGGKGRKRGGVLSSMLKAVGVTPAKR